MNRYEVVQQAITTSAAPVAWAIAGLRSDQRYWRVFSCPFCDKPHFHPVPDWFRSEWTEPIGYFVAPCNGRDYLVFHRDTLKALAAYSQSESRIPIALALREEVKEITRGRCWYCGAEDAEAIDHRWPVVLGGTNDPANLVAACQRCNVRKKAKTVEHFRAAMGGGLFWAEREGIVR